MNNDLHTIEIRSLAVTNPETVDMDMVNVGRDRLDGFYSLHLKTSGAGMVVQAKIKAGNTGSKADMVVPNGASDIVTAHAVGTGLYHIDTKMLVGGFYVELIISDADGQIDFAVIKAQ